MLLENPNQNSTGFRAGDTVKIRDSKQIGKIIGFNNGLYEVSVNGTTIPVNESNLEKKNILLG